MAIYKKWSDFTKKNVDGEGDSFGVYELGDSSGEVIYVGHGRLYPRLMSHFLADGSHAIPGAACYRVEVLGSKERAAQRERSLIREHMRRNLGACPLYNKRLG